MASPEQRQNGRESAVAAVRKEPEIRGLDLDDALQDLDQMQWRQADGGLKLEYDCPPTRPLLSGTSPAHIPAPLLIWSWSVLSQC